MPAFMFLPPSKPACIASLPKNAGFKKSVRSGLEIRLACRQELDIRLELGEVQQTIEVTGEAQLLETVVRSAARTSRRSS